VAGSKVRFVMASARQRPSSESLLADIYTALIGCVIKISSERVLHRDITPDNILISATADRIWLTLIDVSFARFATRPAKRIVYNRDYSAPEQRQGNETFASEVYAVGGVCYFLANGGPPDPLDAEAFESGLSRIDLGLNDWRGESVDWREHNEDPCSGAAMVRALLKGAPHERPTMTRDLELTASSRAASCFEPIHGIIDLSDHLILVQSGEYRIVAKTDADGLQRIVDTDGIANESLSEYLRTCGVRIEARHYEPKYPDLDLSFLDE
jgi:serine/threonine protein kinase